MCAGAKCLVHPLARRGFLRAEKAHALQLELAADERSKREPLDDDVPTKDARPFSLQAELRAQPLVCLPLKKCDLPFVIRFEIKEPVSLDTSPSHAPCLGDFYERMLPGIRAVASDIVVARADENMPDACAHEPELARRACRTQTEIMPHNAALIAGGKSTRMGRDKAALILGDRPLWQHQLDTLAATQPAALFVAGKCAAIPETAAHTVPDEWPDCGPLGGIATALSHSTAPWLLVLAVDMPAMTPFYLSTLLAHAARTGRGAVPQLGGRWEPLAAVYPLSALPLARFALAGKDFAMRPFIESARDAGLLDAVEVSESEFPLFANFNTPEEWAKLGLANPARSLRSPT